MQGRLFVRNSFGENARLVVFTSRKRLPSALNKTAESRLPVAEPARFPVWKQAPRNSALKASLKCERDSPPPFPASDAGMSASAKCLPGGGLAVRLILFFPLRAPDVRDMLLSLCLFFYFHFQAK